MANESAIREAMKTAGIEPGGDLAEVEPDQDELFGDEMEEEAHASADQFGALTAVKGRGRPKGARNRTTKRTIELILASKRDPLLFLADIVTMQPAEVGKLYGCEGAQALGHQIRAASELAGYIHSKKPTDVKVSGEGFIGVTIQLGGPGDAQPDLKGGETVDHDPRPVRISGTYEDEGEEVTSADSHKIEKSNDETSA